TCSAVAGRPGIAPPGRGPGPPVGPGWASGGGQAGPRKRYPPTTADPAVAHADAGHPESEAAVRPTMLLGAVLCWASCAPAAQAGPRRPNIVFILADDLGYGELGCYGQKKILTPNLDRLAREGVRFTRCYAGSCLRAPSRSALMTGLHTGHTPVRANGGGTSLLAEDVTVARVLKQAGYATGGFGKWGLGTEGSPGHPNRQGFDEF